MSSASEILCVHDAPRIVPLSGPVFLLLLFLSCTCSTGPLPVAATKQASGLRQDVPCLLSLPRLTSKLGSAFSLHGLRFQNNSRDADLMSSLNNSRVPEADL